METVAFYSYKGGVGRSFLLANAARFLASIGKKVVALDFDFEAPGLHYKLGVASLRKGGGAVPYLIATADGAASPPPLRDHLINVSVPKKSGGWLRLMPAGPAPRQSYWAALKVLGERFRFGDPSGRGFMALLDLQARISDELKPDYLLIDARTGVTELGGLATTLLADTVVCMFVPNHESLDGTLAVVKALKAAPRLANQPSIRVVPIVTRVVKLRRDRRLFSGIRSLAALCGWKGGNMEAVTHDEDISAGDFPASPIYPRYLGFFKDLFQLPGHSHRVPSIPLAGEDQFFRKLRKIVGEL
jgi:hypothetical protein